VIEEKRIKIKINRIHSPHDSVMFINHQTIAIQELFLWSAAKECANRLQGLRQVNIVGIEICQNLTGSDAKSIGDRGGLALVRLRLPSRNIGCIFSNDVRAIIG